MKKLILAILVFLLFGSSFANAERVYYCASELGTGFKIDKETGKWEERGFNQQRYTIKFNDEYTSLDGMDKSSWSCVEPFEDASSQSPILKNRIICYHKFDAGMVFMFDKQTHRFLYMFGSVYGYLDNEKDSDSNAIFAGTCQKF